MSRLPLRLFTFLGLVTGSLGLTCTPLTENTCTKSLYVTGKCVSGVCECIKGKTQNEFGCYEMYKPTTSMSSFQSGSDNLKMEDWSGEMDIYGSITFNCNPRGISPGNYKWFRNGVEENVRPSDSCTMYVPKQGKEKFQCSINNFGSVTNKSDAFEVTVLRIGEKFTEKPKVEMPSSVANNSVMKIACKNIPSFTGSFIFEIEGEKIREERYPATYLKMNADRFNKIVTCTVKSESDPSNQISSDPVRTPLAPSKYIPSVVVVGKGEYFSDQHLYLECQFNATFQRAGGDTIIYIWTGPTGVIIQNSTNLRYQVNRVTTKASGKYSCSAIYNNGPAVKSPEFNVSVIDVGQCRVTSNHNPVIGGYILISCDILGTPPPYPQFAWGYKVQTSVQQYSDSMIQFNDIKEGDLNTYVTCSLATGIKSIAYIPAPLPMSTFIQPKVVGTTHDMETYNFDCSTDYSTPGIEYEWFVDGAKQENGLTSKYSYKQSSLKPVDVKCRLSFNSGLSDYSKNCTIPAKGSIMTPVILVKDSLTSFMQGSSYTLLCSCFKHAGAHYEWKQDGVRVSAALHHFNFQAYPARDGQYTCTITLGNVSKESQPLKIVAQNKMDTPVIKVVIRPAIFANASYANILSGKTHYLLCSSKFHHTHDAQYSWKKNGRKISGEPRILPLLNVSKFDNGIYTCEIDIRGKKGSSHIKIDVTGKDSDGGYGQRAEANIAVMYVGILIALYASSLRLLL